MARFCPNCGNELSENSNFCAKCGSSVNGNENNGSTVVINNYNNNEVKLPERNIVVCILLSLITCGIYGIYWFIVMTDESNMVSDDQTASGGTAFLFTIITCGIYFYYWNYKMGQKLHQAGQKYNKPIGDNSIVYLLLSIFGLGIINYCIIKSDLNRFSQ